MYHKVPKEIIDLLVQENDQNAFLEIYETLLPKIYKFFHFRVRSNENAEDLTQEFFCKIIPKISTFEWRGVGSFEAWSFQFARNIFLDFLKKQKKHKYVSLEEHDFQIPDDSIEDARIKEDIEQLMQGLEKLNESQREIIELKYMQELSISEICEISGKSESAVKVALMRARNKLKEVIEEECM
jgi:RNA polymerase sigma-70 factor, ECF subfamily